MCGWPFGSAPAATRLSRGWSPTTTRHKRLIPRSYLRPACCGCMLLLPLRRRRTPWVDYGTYISLRVYPPLPHIAKQSNGTSLRVQTSAGAQHTTVEHTRPDTASSAGQAKAFSHLLEPAKRQPSRIELFCPRTLAVAPTPALSPQSPRRAVPLPDRHQPFLPGLAPHPLPNRRHAASPPVLGGRLGGHHSRLACLRAEPPPRAFFAAQMLLLKRSTGRSLLALLLLLLLLLLLVSVALAFLRRTSCPLSVSLCLCLERFVSTAVIRFPLMCICASTVFHSPVSVWPIRIMNCPDILAWSIFLTSFSPPWQGRCASSTMSPALPCTCHNSSESGSGVGHHPRLHSHGGEIYAIDYAIGVQNTR